MSYSASDWVRFHQQLVDGQSQHSTTVPPNATSTTESVTSDAYVLNVASSGQVPEASSSRPIKRRSRASKKTPTTLLNADASNFRALVQQFTGRPINARPKASRLHRPPVNINFARGREEHQLRDADSTVVPIMWDRSSYEHQQQNNARSQPQLYGQQVIEQRLPHESSSVHSQQLLDMELYDGFMPHDLGVDEPSWASPF